MRNGTLIILAAALVGARRRRRGGGAGDARDARVTIQPRINVPPSSTAYFRGKDPALAAALAYRVR
jgi:hypothetical protein